MGIQGRSHNVRTYARAYTQSAKHVSTQQAETVQYSTHSGVSTVHFHVGVQSCSLLRGEGMNGLSTQICAYNLEKAGYGPGIDEGLLHPDVFDLGRF